MVGAGAEVVGADVGGAGAEVVGAGASVVPGSWSNLTKQKRIKQIQYTITVWRTNS